MSTTRQDIQADLVSKIKGTDMLAGLAAEICPSQSFRELLEREAGGSLPAVGIAYRGRVPDGERLLASKRGAYETRWEVSAVSRNGLGRVDALAEVMALMDKIGSRVVNETCSSAGGSRYLLVNEDVDDVEDDGVVGLFQLVVSAWMDN